MFSRLSLELTTSWQLDGTESQRVANAVRLFTDQRMRLPDVRVCFHESQAGCNGHYGLYQPELRAVHVCSQASHVLPHELAHAWMVEHLNAKTRRTFLELRGLDAWTDPSDDWRSRSVEDAAILLRMVLTENGGPSNSPGWDDKREAFKLLTGNQYVRRRDTQKPLLGH